MTDRLEAKRANHAVWQAVSNGSLVRQPCEVCGKPPRFRDNHRWAGYQEVVAHHNDYSKPLDVRWLCRFHHAAYHRSIGSYANNGRRVADPRRERAS